MWTELKPELNKNARVVRDRYPELPKGTIVTVNDIQFNYYGRNSHRYWVQYGGKNWAFNQKEIKRL